MSREQYKYKFTNVNVKKIVLLDEQLLKGVFIHRDLNMPRHCYSLEIEKNG